ARACLADIGCIPSRFACGETGNKVDYVNFEQLIDKCQLNETRPEGNPGARLGPRSPHEVASRQHPAKGEDRGQRSNRSFRRHAPHDDRGYGAASDTAPRSISDELAFDYHPAVEAILNQHGWNLFWAGAATIVGAAFIWRKNLTSIWVTALIGGLFDVGYFVFIDLGGYGTFFPGTSMTYVSATAIILSFWVWYSGREHLN
ncbi:MAG: hypothetical protein AAGL49_13215, partial [Pseudomonadota bacterium]